MIKTKLIFTVGPTSENEEILSKLIETGMSASRHNFSHGDHEEHGKRIELVKKLREKYNRPIAIILDTKGPEIRCGDFEKKEVLLTENQEFTVICGEDILGNEKMCTVSYDKLHEDVKPGNLIMINDGLVSLKVVNVEENKIKCIVQNNGVVGSKKNVNVIGASVRLPALTEKDIEDLKFGCKVGVDMVAASFIRKASDVVAIRKILTHFGGENVKIIAKIEDEEGVKNIDEILKLSDAIMVARGDLGVCIPIDMVPITQKMIIKRCNNAGKPVVIATQMLDSMVRNPRPTRAEVSDIANAIYDGTDAIMLSGETAFGKYPVESATTMSKIAETTENEIKYGKRFKSKEYEGIRNVANAIAIATCTTALELGAKAIITATQSGNTARLVAKYRPGCAIIAATPNKNVGYGLALNFGVRPILTDQFVTTDELVKDSVDTALETKYVNKGDLVVIAAGIPVTSSGTTNMLKVHIVGDILVNGKGVGNNPAYGTAKIIDKNSDLEYIEQGDILVAKSLDKEYLTVIDKVSGIIAEEGGLTSDMAIECIVKEIPLITNAEGACSVLKTGSFITMDTLRGVVYSGKSSTT
ncbi:MAG: pyruvate kinase [Clostridiaceae bacterium]